MAFEQRPNSGTLFKNRDKKEPKHPDLKGDGLIEIAGTLYPVEIGAWTKETPKAGKFLSLSLKLKQSRSAPI
jgi:hypothetical protein